MFFRLLVRDDLVVGLLEDLGFAGGGIVLGVHEALPLAVVDTQEVGAVVEAGVTGLFTEGDVLHVQAHGPQAMVVFPATQQFVQVAGGQLGGVFFHHAQQIEAGVQQSLGGGVVGTHAAAVFVGALHEAHHEVLGRDVVGVHHGVGGGVLAGQVVVVRTVDQLLQFFGGTQA